MLCLVRLGVHYGSDAFWAGGIEVALCFLVGCVSVPSCSCVLCARGFACFTMLLDK